MSASRWKPAYERSLVFERPRWLTSSALCLEREMDLSADEIRRCQGQRQGSVSGSIRAKSWSQDDQARNGYAPNRNFCRTDLDNTSLEGVSLRIE